MKVLHMSWSVSTRILFIAVSLKEWQEHHLELLRNANFHAPVPELDSGEESSRLSQWYWCTRMCENHCFRVWARVWNFCVLECTYFWEIANISEVVIPIYISTISGWVFPMLLVLFYVQHCYFFRGRKSRRLEQYLPAALIYISFTN